VNPAADAGDTGSNRRLLFLVQATIASPPIIGHVRGMAALEANLHVKVREAHA